eukprot:1301827-Amphidinium_carterae.1
MDLAPHAERDGAPSKGKVGARGGTESGKAAVGCGNLPQVLTSTRIGKEKGETQSIHPKHKGSSIAVRLLAGAAWTASAAWMAWEILLP